MIDSGPALTQDHEGYCPIYLDSLGFPTQGYGSLLTNKRPYKNLKEYHEELFQEQYAEAEAEYNKLGLDLDPVRRAAVVDLVYNLGIKKFSRFGNTLAALKMRDWESAVRCLENTLWYKQVGRRGPRICKLIKHGTWEAL